VERITKCSSTTVYFLHNQRAVTKSLFDILERIFDMLIELNLEQSIASEFLPFELR